MQCNFGIGLLPICLERLAYRRAILLPLWVHNGSNSNTLKSMGETKSGYDNVDYVTYLLNISLMIWITSTGTLHRRNARKVQEGIVFQCSLNSPIIMRLCVFSGHWTKGIPKGMMCSFFLQIILWSFHVDNLHKLCDIEIINECNGCTKKYNTNKLK